jgi:hypothetical protein
VIVKFEAVAVAAARVTVDIGTVATAALAGIESLATAAAAMINTSILNGSASCLQGKKWYLCLKPQRDEEK